MTEKLIDLLIRRCRLLTLLCLLSVVLPVYWLRNAQIDNSIEVWIETGDARYEQYRQFLDKYGNEEFIIVAAEADDPLSDDVLQFQKDLAERLRRFEEVDGVLDISAPAELFAAHRDDWKQLLAQNTLFRNLLLGEDGRTFGLIVWLKKIDSPPQRKAIFEKIESAVTDSAAGRMPVHLAGTPVMNVALDRGSQEASRRFLPVALLVSVIILTVVLRRPSGVIAVIFAVAVTTVWTVGLMAATGKTFNMVTVTLPSLLVILSLSGGIHLVSRFAAMLPETTDATTALRNACREVLPPVLLSNITTAVGFGSLMISDMKPVADFGLFAAIGIALSFIFNAILVPGTLSWLHVDKVRTHRPGIHWTVGIGRTVVRTRWAVLAAVIVLSVVSILPARRIRAESNVLKFFPENSKVSRDYHFIAERLTGLYTIELDCSTETENAASLVKQIEQLGSQLLEQPQVAQVIHYKNVATCLNAVPKQIGLTAATSANPLRPMMRKYRHSENGTVSLRMSIFVRAMSSKDFFSLTNLVQDRAATVIQPPAHYKLTGVVPLLNAAQHSLVRTQIRTFATAATIVLILIGVFLRSIRASIAALAPNLLPILLLFATMGLFSIALDAATVMIAGIAIGIAADDTIHFLACFKRHSKSGRDNLSAIAESFNEAGRAITFTSIVSTFGFAILLLAQFKPIQYFGLLAGVTMVTAWACDIFVLPACVSTLRLWQQPEPKI